jgi:predicted permease
MAQIALALTLLTGAALTARSFWRLTTSGLGFDTTRLVTFRIDLTADRFANVERRGAVTRAMLDRFREVPGVTDAMLWGPSMLGRATWVTYLIPEGRPDDGAESSAMISMHAISPGALQALGIPLRRGRELEWSDDLDAPRVAVVSESVARALWPNGDAVGKRVRRRGNPAAPWVTVVGVAADARHRVRLSALDAAQGMPPSGLGPQYDIYFTSVQRHETSLVFGVRVADAADPTGVVAALRSALAGIDSGLPLHDVSMLDERIARQEAPLRALAIVAVAYAVIALLLASLGVYGVLAESVAQRVQEIGVRIALGAGQLRVLCTVLTSGAVMLAWGMALGLAGGQIVAQAARSLLYGIDPADAGTIGTAIVLLAAAVFAAALVPAIRASRIDPIAALRADP